MLEKMYGQNERLAPEFIKVKLIESFLRYGAFHIEDILDALSHEFKDDQIMHLVSLFDNNDNLKKEIATYFDFLFDFISGWNTKSYLSRLGFCSADIYGVNIYSKDYRFLEKIENKNDEICQQILTDLIFDIFKRDLSNFSLDEDYFTKIPSEVMKPPLRDQYNDFTKLYVQ